MKRFIMEKLVKWKNSKVRKPLILRGARQVGKTYVLKEFGKENYKNVVYFNFDHDEDLKNLFSNTKDPNKIIEKLSFVVGRKILPESTLIIFDEIQECSSALNSLKYFCEEANEFHVVCAGNLLGIKLSKTSFSVGKVDFLNLFPMTFSEFLIADGSENLVEYMNSVRLDDKIDTIFASLLEEKLKTYFIVGGMPEVVNSWVLEKDIERVNYLQETILLSYESDLGKHTTAYEANKISLIWNNVPSQLARENKKFVYQVVKEGARAREYESALNWLNDADLIKKVYNISKPIFPLKAYNDLSSFKIYMLDVGLLRKMTGLDSSIIIEGNRLFEEFKGSFTENYVLNMLYASNSILPNYYTFGRYEIDFVIQCGNKVKANKNKKHAILTNYNLNNDNEISIRFSLDNIKKDGKIINIPLYLVEYLDNMIK